MERNIKLLAIFNFFLDFRFHSAILVLYFAQVTGSYTLAMSIYAIVMVSSALFEVPTGILSDRIGRKQTIVIGSLFSVISALLYALGYGYWWLFFGAVGEGISRAFFSGNNDALLHDSLTAIGKRDRYDHYLGRVSAMFQAALAVSVVIGSILAYFSFSLVMWLSVIPQILSLIVSLFIIEPSVRYEGSTNIFSHLSDSVRLIVRNRRLRLLALGSVIKFGVQEASFHFRSAFIATLWPVWAIGFSKMISFIGGGISSWYAGSVIRKFSAINILLFDSIVGKVVNTVAVLFPTVVSPILMASNSFLYGVKNVSLNSLMQKEFSDRERATMASITAFGGSLLYGIVSILLGVIADRWSTIMALLFAQICGLPNIALYWKYKRDLHT